MTRDDSGVRRRPDLVDLEERLFVRRLYTSCKRAGMQPAKAALVTLNELELWRSQRRLADVPDYRRAA